MTDTTDAAPAGAALSVYPDDPDIRILRRVTALNDFPLAPPTDGPVRFVTIVDTETTGTDPIHDEIIDIAVVTLEVDVDVVFYISGEDADAETLEDLTARIYDLLVEQYPSKSVEDFEIQRKAATVTFVASGLVVDIVPVIEDPGRHGYGWQYDIRDGSKVETCAPCQIKFVRDRKNVDGDFRTLVRMAKKWRNWTELKPLKSFAIELIMAYLFDTRGKDGSIEQRFRDFLLYVAQSGLKEVISFPENTGEIPAFTDPVVIIDPVASANNVASRITEAEREEIVAVAQEAWETAHFASAEDDHSVWKEMFGPQFRTEDIK